MYKYIMPTRLICEFEQETVDRYSTWTEAVAFRFVRVDEDHVRFEVTNNLERVTRPEGDWHA